MYERTTKQSHLDTIRYEIDMLIFTFEELTKQSLEIPRRYVFLEGFLLHYRTLIQFFAGNRRKHRAGDLSTYEPQTWARRALTQEEINTLQSPGQKLEDQYWTDISQFLQHSTERRYLEFKDWNVQEMYNDLKTVITAFESAFPRPTVIPVSDTLGGGQSTASFTKIEKIF